MPHESAIPAALVAASFENCIGAESQISSVGTSLAAGARIISPQLRDRLLESEYSRNMI